MDAAGGRVDINAGIIDQHVNSLVGRLRDEITQRIGKSKDDHRIKSAAYAMLCLQHAMSADEESALDALTDGGDDAGIDALLIGDVVDGEFSTTIVQSKYSRNLEGRDGYPANSITRVIATVGMVFDPGRDLHVHPRLAELVTEVRGLILDGNIPEVRVLLCNNGRKWEPNGEAEIQSSGLAAKRVSFVHVNHDKIVGLLQKRRSIDTQLSLSGKAFVEDFDYRRVLVGKLPVSEVKSLFDVHGDTLLDRNIRRYLGLRDNRVNMGIHATLSDSGKRPNFYFFNNGITAVCSKFSYNALQQENWELSVSGLQIVNGGQTCKTIQRTLLDDASGDYTKTYVLLRLYEISSKDDAVVNNITFATNSQNPVDVTDLRSNDPVQERLALGLRDLGFEYKRKRDDQASGAPDVITSAVAAEAIMAVWRKRPNAAKFRRGKLFSDSYDDVFSDDLQPSHVVLSVLAFRLVENERKRPKRGGRPRFVPYASHFLAMVVGDLLLQSMSLTRETVSHLNVVELRTTFEKTKDKLYDSAVDQVAKALAGLGVTDETSLPRIAAQFRRGDLLEPLQKALSLQTPVQSYRVVVGAKPRVRAKVKKQRNEGRRAPRQKPKKAARRAAVPRTGAPKPKRAQPKTTKQKGRGTRQK
jgi:hypothetical protein